MITLQQIIEAEINKVGSARQLAERANINHEVINSMRNHPDYRPSIGTLLKLSKYTGLDLTSLVAIAYPDIAEETRPNSAAMIMAQRFASLPPEIQKVIWLIMQNQ
jgi:ribosome-binding protein aMBF1 (putative translation factor)